MQLTERETICLRFLSDKMWSSARLVGRAIYDGTDGRGGSNLAAIGGNVLGALKRKGLVVYLPDVPGWRVSREGRQWLEGQVD